MVIDKLEHIGEYVSLHPLFAQVAEFLKSTDWATLEIGKKELKGKELWVNVAQTQPKTSEEARLEAHKEYIDIQIPISDVEVMGYTPLQEGLPVSTPYNAEKDIMFFDGPAESYLTVKPGMFAIFFPQDVHAPGITPKGVKKIIVKIKV